MLALAMPSTSSKLIRTRRRRASLGQLTYAYCILYLYIALLFSNVRKFLNSINVVLPPNPIGLVPGPDGPNGPNGPNQNTSRIQTFSTTLQPCLMHGSLFPLPVRCVTHRLINDPLH